MLRIGNNDSIIIRKPDKGNGIVIVNKLEFVNKMKQSISDETKSKKNKKQNPTKSRENTLLTYLCKLIKDGILHDGIFQKIPPSCSSSGVLYGLPKVHMSGCPFHPIVSSVETYNYNVPSYLIRILQLILHQPVHG